MVRVLVVGSDHEPLIAWAAGESIALDIDGVPEAASAEGYDVVLLPEGAPEPTGGALMLRWEGMEMSANTAVLRRESDSSILTVLSDPAALQKARRAAIVVRNAQEHAALRGDISALQEALAELQTHAYNPPEPAARPSIASELFKTVQGSTRIQTGLMALLIALALVIAGGKVKSLAWGDAQIHLSDEAPAQHEPSDPQPSRPAPAIAPRDNEVEP